LKRSNTRQFLENTIVLIFLLGMAPALLMVGLCVGLIVLSFFIYALPYIIFGIIGLWFLGFIFRI